MPYIGTSPSNGVRRVHTYTATASQTTFSGAGAEGTTLSYKDSNYVDVYQNGIKLGDADYTSTSGTSIVLAQGASVDDLVVVVVFDVFSVADTVSKADGGTFDGNVTMGGTLDVSGAFTSQGIDDNADATAITIDSSEQIGIGTASPLDLVHIKEANGTATSTQLMLQNTNSGSGSAGIGFQVSSDGETSSYVPKSAILFERTSSNGRGVLKFMSDNVDDTNPFSAGDEVMRITRDGNLLVNKTNTTEYTSGCIFRGNNASVISADNDALIVWADNVTANTGGTKGHILFKRGTNAALVGSITSSTSATAYNTSSDYRLKENVDYTFDATTRLKQLRPCRFNFIADADTTVDGFLAHEVSSVVPEAISGDKDATDDDGNIVAQGIDQSKLVPLLVKTIQELEARITALEGE